MTKNYLLNLILTCIFTSTSALIYAQNVALDFDGINDYVQTNAASISGNTPKTIEAWIKTTKNSLPTASGQSVIVDFGTFVNGQRFTFNILWSNAIRLEVGGNGLSGLIPVNDGLWHHVAASYNPATNPTTKLYVDGILDVAGNLTVPVNTGTLQNIRIGKRIDDVNFFEGSIDEVRVFNIARDSVDIYNDMDSEFCGTLPASLVSYFKLNEGIANGANLSNNLATDYVANNTNSLIGFGLTGIASNWVNGPSIAGPVYINLNDASCDTVVSPSGNFAWTASGIYYDTLVASSGCDSILIVDVSILKSFDTISVLSCGNYTAPSGAIFTSSGTYQDTLFNTNVTGCDSIITINLSIGTFSSTTIDTLVCDQLTLGGTTYSMSTIINDTLTSGLGCDSVVIYNITIDYSVNDTATFSACDSVEVNGVWYFNSQSVVFNGTTNSAAACDSTYTLNVIVGASSMSSTESITACDSILIEGDWYTLSGNLTFLYTNNTGCDSSHIIDLTIESIMYEVVQITDWTITINNITGATYNWYYCADSTLFTTDTSGYFSPNVIGEFFVEINLGNCSYSSPCLMIVGEGVRDVYSDNFQLLPNPNKGSFIIDLGEKAKAVAYQILDVSGRVVLEKNIDQSSVFEVNTSLRAGIYFILIDSDQAQFAKKFMVK